MRSRHQIEGHAVLARARRFTEARGRELAVGAAHWRYVRLGSGPAVLWLTGGLRRAALGSAFLERLAATHTVVAPDYPPVTAFAEVDAGLSAILAAEGIERCDLVGQSYGGLLAQAFLAAHPERIRRLVLSSSGPADYGRRWLPVLALAVAVVRVLPRPLLTRLLVRGLSGLLPSGPGPRAEWTAVLWRTIGRDLTRADAVSHFAVAADVVRRGLVRPDRFARWPGDVIVLRAENDPTQAAEDVPRLERLLGRPVRVISMGSAGHTAVLLAPDRYAQWLEDALAVRPLDM
ncbi:pimeloyl-ACP methyl ester carboxylesterase [Sinomonas atrocyanea]|uniref:alpha/beta fold hydrolase n=1 Tax=Sinomonas atrocyanea TaxID=37927 RepID=UPI002785393E|nr:alpha/beta hydrolase [Sinomonas atrocyanea]MDP9884649.1 pimeloyl-ACP methyl ester carboxylesterase [Sinomonas atrocyanea]